MKHIGSFLEDLMQQRNVSMRRLALDVGVSPSTLSRWLSGKQTPSLQSCQKLAESLVIPVEQVLAWSGHLVAMQKADASTLPEFREYARQKYPSELDEDMITMIEDLIRRRRRRLNESH
ncbi:MAG: helix-turn-helix transcriptional regulator [Dehalococcoidia bacterium]